jgi:hypothetical protein
MAMHSIVSANASHKSLNRCTEAQNSRATGDSLALKTKTMRPELFDEERMPSPFKKPLSPGQQTMGPFMVPVRRRRIDDNDSDDDKPLVPSPATTQDNPVVIYDTDDNFTIILRSEQPPAQAAASVAASAAAPQVTLKPRRSSKRRSRNKRVRHQAQQTVSTNA